MTKLLWRQKIKTINKPGVTDSRSERARNCLVCLETINQHNPVIREARTQDSFSGSIEKHVLAFCFIFVCLFVVVFCFFTFFVHTHFVLMA